MLNVSKMVITAEGCTKSHAESLLSLVSESFFHGARSHGSWIEYKNASHFIVVNCRGKCEHVTVESAGKSLTSNERMFYNQK